VPLVGYERERAPPSLRACPGTLARVPRWRVGSIGVSGRVPWWYGGRSALAAVAPYERFGPFPPLPALERVLRELRASASRAPKKTLADLKKRWLKKKQDQEGSFTRARKGDRCGPRVQAYTQPRAKAMALGTGKLRAATNRVR
jgi:hypothetical protein